MLSGPIEIMNGVTFFPNPYSCITHFDDAPLTTKIWSTVQSYGTLFNCFLDNIDSVFRGAEAQMIGYTKIPAPCFSGRKLVVFLHGLGSNPSQFKTIIDKIASSRLPETDVYIPYILQKGHAKLDEMIRPIFEVIEKWNKTGGDKELVLVGISNGGRIARGIEAHLYTLENLTKLRFVSIVGACKGSSLADLANKLCLSWVLSTNIGREMPTNSARTAQLNEDWQAAFRKPSRCTREYTFIASPHDWQVPNYESTLPEIPVKEGVRTRYAIVPCHGHISVVNAVAQTVAELVSIDTL